MRTKNVACVCLLSCLLFVACNMSTEHPGYNYMPDMIHNQAVESYAKELQVFITDSQAVSINNSPYPLDKKSRELAGTMLVNPVDDSILVAGEASYKAYCLVCHGQQGDGKGPLFTSGKFPYAPGSLISEKNCTIPDGEIFHVAMKGFNLMRGMEEQVNNTECWHTVNYIRFLQE